MSTTTTVNIKWCYYSNSHLLFIIRNKMVQRYVCCSISLNKYNSDGIHCHAPIYDKVQVSLAHCNNVTDVTTEETNSLLGVGDCLRTIARHDTQHCPAIVIDFPVFTNIISVISIGIVSNGLWSSSSMCVDVCCCCCCGVSSILYFFSIFLFILGVIDLSKNMWGLLSNVTTCEAIWRR